LYRYPGLNSSSRKRILCGWLRNNHEREFNSPLKLQKFLFFYELYSKIENDIYELRSLKGYIHGPVFSDVYGDYTYEYLDFAANALDQFRMYSSDVNEDRAELSCFLVRVHTEMELSKLTHGFNIWNSKEDEINRGKLQVPLYEEFLSENDIQKLLFFKEIYTPDFINSTEVLNVDSKNFLIPKKDLNRLTSEHIEVIEKLSYNKELTNPVYLSIDEDGVILVD